MIRRRFRGEMDDWCELGDSEVVSFCCAVVA